MKITTLLAILLLQGCTYVGVDIEGDVSCTVPPLPIWGGPLMGPPRPTSRGMFREGFYSA